MDFVCELCFPNAKEIGKICDYLYLVFWEEKYHLISHNGHKGDILHTFDIIPYEDPDPDCIDNSIEADIWIENLLSPLQSLKLPVLTGYRIYNAAISTGFNMKIESIESWIINKADKLIKEYNDTRNNLS